jgi:hypothetical protein
VLRHIPIPTTLLILLVVVCPARAQDVDTVRIRQVSEARIHRDAAGLVEAIDRLAEGSPGTCACVAQRIMDEDPWPDAGFDDNEAFRTYLTAHLAALGIVPPADCSLVWTDHVRLDLPEALADPLQLAQMDLEDKRAVLMQLALYAPYERSLFDRLIHLAGIETQPEAQELVLMAAARLLGRAQDRPDQEAGALMTLLYERAQQPSTRAGAADIAGVVVARVPSVNLIVMTQYLGDAPAEQVWALDVWRRTDFRHLDDTRGMRVVELLLDSNADGEFGWAVAGVLAHIDPLTSLVESRIGSMLGSSLETTRVRGVQWAGATRIAPEVFLPWMIQLHGIDTAAVRAMCLWGIAELVGSTDRYDEVAPLLPTVSEDLHAEDPLVREAAADLLKQLLSTECRHRGSHAGLETILPALVAQLDTEDAQRRSRVVDLLRRVRADCLPAEVQRELVR